MKLKRRGWRSPRRTARSIQQRIDSFAIWLCKVFLWCMRRIKTQRLRWCWRSARIRVKTQFRKARLMLQEQPLELKKKRYEAWSYKRQFEIERSSPMLNPKAFNDSMRQKRKQKAHCGMVQCQVHCYLLISPTQPLSMNYAETQLRIL
jgi:hypothetical protein